jgi:acetyltransferase-like isoleucine patch superfamily enzyme
MPIADDVESCRGSDHLLSRARQPYGCSIGKDTTIGPFVEIGRGVKIGARCKISTHSYLCSGVTIEDDVFVGHGVMFVNDIEPIATIAGRRINVDERELLPTLVKRGAMIGSGAVIIGGVSIGAEALIGAGAVVTHDVVDKTVVAGVPARLLRQRS